MPTFDHDGVRLYYELHGDPTLEPLVLLEGMGGEIRGWRRNLPRLSERFRVLAYDFRGNGRSDRPDVPTAMDSYVGDTLALMDVLEIDRAHVYGQSFGGMVAQVLALDHPERVLGLVLGCTHGGRHVVRLEGTVPKGRPFMALYAPGFVEANREHVAEDLMAGARTRQPAHARRRQREAILGFDVYDRLPGLRAPTLVLHGTADRLLSPENGRRLAERIPNARLHLIEGAGHVYHSERAEEADRAVIEFLSRVSA